MLRSLQPYLSPRGRRLLIGARERDDAALWSGQPGDVVGTVDTMVENIDFRLQWPGETFRLLGRRLLSINLSDLAAMGAEPRHALISLSLPTRLKLADIRALYRGIAERAQQYGCTVAGGDVSAIDGPMVLTAALYGLLAKGGRPLRRQGARPGWLLAVTGSLGAAAAGLRLLESRRRPRTTVERAWVAAQLDPAPQVAAGLALVRAGITVGGDISDGLHREVERLVEGDRFGATIDIGRVPLARGLERAQWQLAVRESEDFELICAAPRGRIVAAQRSLERISLRLTVIGAIESRPGVRLQQGNRIRRLAKGGYEHFR